MGVLAALLPILEAVIPPLASAIWKIIQAAMDSKIDHATAVSQMHEALTAAAGSMASFREALEKADAGFEDALTARYSDK